MHWLFSILLIIVGALAAYPGRADWPNFPPGLDKMVPYQGWFGIVALVWGAINLLQILLHFAPSP